MNAEVEDDDRNDWGLPTPIEVTAHERSNQTTKVDVDNSNRKNDALPWVAISWFLSGGAVIGLILFALLMPGIIRSEVAAGVSNAKAEMSKEVSAAIEQANSARTFGRLANEKSDRVLAQLEARGLVKQENH